LTVDRSNEGLSAGTSDHPEERKDTQSDQSPSDTNQEYVLLTQLVRSGFPMLKPRKMIRTIESKLHGATRLSVCRGGVSGEGATLSNASIGSGVALTETERKNALVSTEKAKIETTKRLVEAEAKARDQEEMKETERIMQEKLAAETRAREEATKRAEIERLELERLKRERLAEERHQQEEARRLAEAELLARRVETERREREAREREAARKQAEEDEREHERQQLLAKQREDEARRVAEIKAAEEQALKEKRERDEMLRLAELRKDHKVFRRVFSNLEGVRRLKVNWTFEAQQDLQAMHDIDIQKELEDVI
jgi:hypothetical protein